MSQTAILPTLPLTLPGSSAGTVRRTAFTPGLIAGGLYAALTCGVLLASYLKAAHHFVYPLDDTYIGMAIAKNFALHGVWGVSRYAFSSADSSLLFPLLVAGAYRIAGVNEFAPLILSWLFGLASILVAERTLARFLDRKGQLVALILLVLLPPLFVVGILGMEHSLHLLLTLLFLDYFLDDPPAERLWKIGLVTLLMVASRYEGLFFVAPACAILGLRRRWKPALAIAVAAAIPVVSYAGFSVANGAYWLPNSVALKGAGGSSAGVVPELLARIELNIRTGVPLAVLLFALAAALLTVMPRFSRRVIPLALVLTAGCLHMCLARVTPAFRYEDYLLAAAVVAVASVSTFLRQSTKELPFAVVFFLYLVAGAFLTMRSAAAADLLPACSRCIYLQQWQMAHFLHMEFPGAAVAANDIGAIDYFNDIHCVDVVGLASSHIFFARRANRYTTQFLEQTMAQEHVQIAIVYADWFGKDSAGLLTEPPIPAGWLPVATWSIRDHLTLVEKEVTFFAVEPSTAPRLRSALQDFDPTLPPGVLAVLQ